MYGKLAGAWEQRCPDMHIYVIHVYIASCIYIKAIIAHSTHTVQNVLITYWLGILIFQAFLPSSVGLLIYYATHMTSESFPYI